MILLSFLFFSFLFLIGATVLIEVLEYIYEWSQS